MNNFSFDKCRYETILNDINNIINSLSNNDLINIYKDLFHCIDHTTLRDEDNVHSVREFCSKAVELCAETHIGSMASVCIYPEYAETAKKIVQKIGMRTATVVGGFPTGQMSLPLKLQEVSYAIDNGADELDFVINRGSFLSGDEKYLAKEISAVRRLCGDSTTLKVILETGQLKTPELIYRASTIVMENGADFIKTSTGKCGVGATPEAAYYMLFAIKNFQKNSSCKIGFKVSGGVSTIDDALLYYFMTKKILCIESINNQFFRIGTSRLMSELGKKLTN